MSTPETRLDAAPLPEKADLLARCDPNITAATLTDAISNVFAEWRLVHIAHQRGPRSSATFFPIGDNYSLYCFDHPRQIVVTLVANREGGVAWPSTPAAARRRLLAEAIEMFTVRKPTFVDAAQTVARWVRHGVNIDWWEGRTSQILDAARALADADTDAAAIRSQIALLEALGVFAETGSTKR